MDIQDWLRGLGLEQYALAFRENDIDGDILPELTAEDLTGLGVASIGHRRKLLAAIAALREAPDTPAPEPVPPPPPARSDTQGAERRLVTILFCDLVGSTELSGRLDPEELHDVIAAYHRRVADVIGRLNGFVAKYMGDGVLCYFGFPIAHEDDAERAVRAGLAITETVPDLDGRGSRLRARVGIATGLVVAGDLAGGDTNAVVGETPNLAARLQSEAPPGAVVIDPATRRLSGSWFRYRDLGPRRLKGIAEPVAIAQILGEHAPQSRFAAVHPAALTPFVGREQEMGLLLDRWQMAADGEGQVVLLSGEAGIGKSRIAEMLRDSVEGNAVRIRYQCSPYHTDTALYPAIRHLAVAAGIEPDEPPASKLEKLERLILPAEITPEFAAALIADLLAIPTGQRYPATTMSPELRKMRTLRVLTEQLFALAQRSPVLVLVEDAHWIDPTTRELLDSLIEPIGLQRVMLLVTGRPDFVNPWSHYAHVTSLPLTRLGRRQSAALVTGVAGRSLPDAIVQTLASRADGVPLFLEELTKSVVESGLLRDAEDGGFSLAGAAPLLAIPTTLQASLLARLDRLGGAREVAQLGAAIGRQFGYRLLTAVTDLPEARLQSALLELEAAGLLFRRGSPPDADYTFKHALVQDAAHESLLKSRRQQLHARIAAAIELHHPDTAGMQPQLLAQHYADAGFAERSARAWLAAGRLATSRSAPHEAAAQFARGIQILQGMEPGAERDAIELDLQIGRGSACTVTSGFSGDDSEQAWLRAIELLRSEPKDPRNFWARRGLSATYSTRANMVAYAAIADETMDRARQADDAAGFCVAHMIFANLYNYTGRRAANIQSLREATRYYRSDAHSASFLLSGLDLGIHIPMNSMLGCSIDGDSVGANRHMDEVIRLAEAQRQIGTLCWALVWVALTCLIERDFARAGASADRAVALATEHGIRIWAANGQMMQGTAALMLDPDRSAAVIGAALEKLEAMQWLLFHPTFLCFRAEALLRLGRISEAREVIDRALAMSASTGLSWWDAELHRIGASVIDAEGGGNEAVREVLRRAAEIAAQQGSEAFRRRAAAELAAMSVC